MSALFYEQARRLTRSAYGDEAAERLFADPVFDAWLWEQSDEIEGDNNLDAKDGGDGNAGTIRFSHLLVKKYPELVRPGYDPDACECDNEPYTHFEPLPELDDDGNEKS
mgnify:CR=1 FL=1